MKQFHISDVLSVTTGRLVSSRHIDGIYEILNFLTGDELFTHQLPRAMRECEPWLRMQFPQLFPEDPKTAALLDKLSIDMEACREDDRKAIITDWVALVRDAHGLPDMLMIYEMGSDMHTHIDPVAEAEAMVGDGRVVVVHVE